MAEKITAEKLFNTLVETVAEKQKTVSFFEEEKSSSIDCLDARNLCTIFLGVENVR